MEIIKTREELPKFFADHGCVVGAEVGVSEGRYSAKILGEPRIKLLYSIDSWTYFPSLEICQESWDKTKKILSQFHERSVIIRGSSTVVANEQFKDNQLDFCYIDADHSYSSCKGDCEAWWPKIRCGGILSGHDYRYTGMAMCPCLWRLPKDGKVISGIPRSRRARLGKCEVKKAVDEFVASRKLELVLVEDAGSWLVFKP